MQEIRKEIYTILDRYAPNNVYLHGTMQAENPPQTFCTYQLSGSEEARHFDNAARAVAVAVDIFFYSVDPLLVDIVPPQIVADLKAAGYIFEGRGSDYPSGRDNMTGWMLEATKIINQ